MPDDKKDVAGVIVFPPLIPLFVLVVGGVLDWYFSVDVIERVPFWPRVIIGALFFALGGAIAILAERAFKHVGTNVNPFRSSLAVARHGIYRHVRNPMYVGMGLALLGIILAFGLEWTLLLAIPGALVIHYGVVLREEHYLERKFGVDYSAYKESVPRYGIKL